MNLVNFFKSAAVELPRKRTGNDFCKFLFKMMQDYLAAVGTLDPLCPLGSRVLADQKNIQQLADEVCLAVETHLNGKPDEARKLIRSALNFVSGRLSRMLSLNVPPDDMQRLFRVSELKPNEALSRERLFHLPFQSLASASSRRYSLPGTACLYVGGSLNVCMLECDINPAKPSRTGIAEFAPRNPIKFLDFGYRPSVVAMLAHARLLSPTKPNPKADELVMNHAVCWPLIAASSIIREPGNPPPEYIVPQLVLGWLLDGNQCRGIRYFSTRVASDTTDIRWCSNFAFPVRNPAKATAGYCPELKKLFELTMPILWQSQSNGTNLGVDFDWNHNALAAMPRAQIP